MTKNEKMLAAIAGVVVVGGLIYLVTKHAASASASSAPTPLPGGTPTAPTTPVVVTLVSGQALMGPVGVLPGSPFTVVLPAGAKWAAGGQLPAGTVVGSSAPVSYTYTTPQVVTLNWTDSSGTSQATAITLFSLPTAMVAVQPVNITLVPNFVITSALPVAVGSTITISLPQGAQWASGSVVLGANIPASGTNTPIVLSYVTPVIFHLNWVDSTNSSQVSNLSFYTP